jgi:hypothetical protein
VTGDDVTDMPITAGVKSALATDVTPEYAGEANPGEWGSWGAGTAPGFWLPLLAVAGGGERRSNGPFDGSF